LTRSDPESGDSQTTGVLVMVALTVMLGAILLALLLGFITWFGPGDPLVPSFIEIRTVYHNNEFGVRNFDSRVLLFHNGTVAFANDDLRADFFRNGEKLDCVVTTFNGHNFISTHHFGVQNMGGMGCSDLKWNPREKILLDFTDGTFHPGDSVRMDVYYKPSDTLISSFVYNA
jgi:hypothetical protein